jgi:predicted aldo/keto reductase-like oxidoreductase
LQVLDSIRRFISRLPSQFRLDILEEFSSVRRCHGGAGSDWTVTGAPTMDITRRGFLVSLAAAASAGEIHAQTGMPMRPLGNTGEKVSLLAFGAGSRWLAYKEQDKALEALDRVLKGGVNYVDSAASYGDGQSEQWIGEFLKTHKKNFFLVTKIGGDRTYDDAMRIIDRSLKNLGVNQVDLMHIHSLGNEDDLAKIEAVNGQLKAMQRAKEQKMTRFIGVTSHTNPQVLKTALERHNFDSTQMALNIAQIGNAAPSDRSGEGMTGVSGFELVAMPVALKKKMGLTAMKVFAQEKLLGKAAPEILVRYAMTLPVAATTIGMPELAHIDFNLAVAKKFMPLSKEEMKSLPSSVTTQMRAAIDLFFADHVDC